MAHMKNRVIYQRGNVKVYINQCLAKFARVRKTKVFAVRRNDKTGLGAYLGSIEYDGAWRQYVFCPDEKTKWSVSCGRAIFDFCEEQTKKLREKWRKR